MPEQGLLEVLRRSGGLVAISQQLEVAPAVAQAAAMALLPLVRGAFRRQVEQADNLSTGLAQLLARLEELGGGALAGRVLDQENRDPAAGEALLRALFGSDDARRLVIVDAAVRSELEPALVGEILPQLAMLAAGYIAARGGPLSSAERLAEFGPLLDLDGEPNPLDLVAGIADD